jgi:hypothetical protein
MLEDPTQGLIAPSAAGAALRAKSGRWLGWVLAIVIIAGCLLFLDIGKVVAVVRRMEAPAIALVLLLLTADRVLMALK